VPALSVAAELEVSLVLGALVFVVLLPVGSASAGPLLAQAADVTAKAMIPTAVTIIDRPRPFRRMPRRLVPLTDLPPF
jgi:hypothetical protein